MDFNTILDRIKKQELILPDFQRGFVWDSEKMKKLYASVLAKIPVGSILTLESKDDNFNCKQIGAKPRCRTIEKPSHSVNYLIDGQQRLTSLLAGFSTYYFENYSDEKEIASNNLLSLYFIKLPAIDNVESDDIFGLGDAEEKIDNSILRADADADNLAKVSTGSIANMSNFMNATGNQESGSVASTATTTQVQAAQPSQTPSTQPVSTIQAAQSTPVVNSTPVQSAQPVSQPVVQPTVQTVNVTNLEAEVL